MKEFLYSLLMLIGVVLVWQHLRLMYGKKIIPQISAKASYMLYVAGCAAALAATFIYSDIIGRVAAVALAVSLITRVATPIIFKKIFPNAAEGLQLATLTLFYIAIRVGCVLTGVALLMHMGRMLY